jgi:hypothetical protein
MDVQFGWVDLAALFVSGVLGVLLALWGWRAAGRQLLQETQYPPVQVTRNRINPEPNPLNPLDLVP